MDKLTNDILELLRGARGDGMQAHEVMNAVADALWIEAWRADDPLALRAVDDLRSIALEY